MPIFMLFLPVLLGVPFSFMYRFLGTQVRRGVHFPGRLLE